MLGDGGELALVDVREELIFSQRHLLLARSVPLSRFELKFAQLWCRAARRASCCATTATASPHAPRRSWRATAIPMCAVLAGGVAAWARRASSCSPASTCRARRSANLSSTPSGTPSIAAPTSSKALIRDGADLVVLDSRPFDEYSRVSIPTATNVPGAELVLRAREIAPSPADDWWSSIAPAAPAASSARSR